MKNTFVHPRLKCAGVAVHSMANHLQWTCRVSNSYLTCVLSSSSLFSSPLDGLSLNQTRKEQASNDCLATSNTCQTKNRAEDREKRRSPATILRPSFTNYTEYLLTGGLSQCLLSHPTTLIFPPSKSHHFPCCYVTVYHVLWKRKLLAPLGKRRRQKKRRIKRIRWRRKKIVESLASRLRLWFEKQIRATRKMMKRL